MRRAARVDGNQVVIVQAARQLGATVQHLHTVGSGCPDLVLGFRGRNIFVEVKDPLQPPRKQKLTPSEDRWHRTWGGEVHIVWTIEDLKQVLLGEACASS